MTQDRFWILLAKKIAEEATAAELEQLQALILEHPQWQFAAQNFEDLWKQRKDRHSLQAEDACLLHLNRMHEKGIVFAENETQHTQVHRITKLKSRRIFWSAAAAIIATVGYFILQTTLSAEKNLKQSISEVVTKNGSKTKIKLPDGSIVMLNANSRLTYSKAFDQDLREVFLSGEGFFEVSKIKGRPFIIHTAQIDIKVLGTVFNVKAYPDDRQTETSLIHGSVEVTINSRPNNKIVLSPNEKLIVDNTIVKEEKAVQPGNAVEEKPHPLISINKLEPGPIDSVVLETQWTENNLVFRDETFIELSHRLERWFDVEIDIQDEPLKEKRLSGTFKSETIDEVLQALKISIPFSFKQSDNKIIIHP